jgi:uncharacterized RDD family membrane protein YckC
MKGNRVGIFKRVFAYIVDVVILVIFMTSLANFIPQDTKSIATLNDELDLVNGELLSREISFSEYIEKSSVLTHELDKKLVLVYVANTVGIIMLLIIIPFIKKGQTIGNMLTKTKVIRLDEDDVTINDLIYRSIFIGFLGYLLVILSVVYILPSMAYFMTALILMFLEFLLAIINLVMITYRYDKMVLHDKFTKTRVINIQE